MYGPVRDLTESTGAKLIEDNMAEFLLTLGRAGGGEERNDPHVHWTIGGSPIDYHNAVVRADLPDTDMDRTIAESVARFRARKVPGTWHVGPGMRPAGIGGRLLAHGFVHAGNEPGMAVDLTTLAPDVDMPAGLAIAEVRGAADLAVWTDTLGRGFGAGPQEAAWVGAMYARLGFGGSTPWRHYLGRLRDEPVATASLFLGAGVAGIYFVFTVAEARRNGIGGAITLAALGNARNMGYRAGVLGASTMGEGVYRRIGFREYCKLGIYEWQARRTESP